MSWKGFKRDSCWGLNLKCGHTLKVELCKLSYFLLVELELFYIKYILCIHFTAGQMPHR